MASGSGWILWVWLAGGECGCKEVSSYYLSLLRSFWQQHPYVFVHFCKCL